MREVNINSIRSVDRAFDILEAFNNDNLTLTIDDIVKKTGLAKATAYRLLYTLEKRGVIQYDTTTLRYSLGLKIMEYAGYLVTENALKKASHDLLIELQQQTQQTVMMVVPDGDTMVYIFTRENALGLKYSSYTGQRRPMNYGVLGKVFMAYAEEEQRNRLLNQEIPKYTKYTITDREVILNQLNQMKEDGVFIEIEEMNPGVHGFGAPILDKNNKCIAAIGIIGPSIQLSGTEMERCKELLKVKAAEISKKIKT